MANLDAYIDFDVRLDFDAPQITITDVGTYPVGVNAGILGIVKITQPDGIIVQGTWSSPDITWNGTILTPAIKELRLTAAGTPQCGTYTVEYTIDHPSYTPTVLTKSFDLNITLPTANITVGFDVFTPELTLTDDTNYAISNFTFVSITREWEVAVGSVTQITGTTQVLDLAYLGNYYDAVYLAFFGSFTTMTHDTYDYLTIFYKTQWEDTLEANTPPAINDLVECLNELKAQLDAEADVNCCTTLENKYGKAERRLSHLIHTLLAGFTDGALNLITEFINLTACAYSVNRNQPILPYDLTLYINLGSLPTPYDFIVTSGSFVTSGSTNKVITAFIGFNIQFYRGGALQSTVANGGSYYTWNKVTGQLTFLSDVPLENGAAVLGELFQIYPAL